MIFRKGGRGRKLWDGRREGGKVEGVGFVHALRGWKDELMRIEGSLLLILLLCGFAFRRAGLRFNKEYTSQISIHTANLQTVKKVIFLQCLYEL